MGLKQEPFFGLADGPVIPPKPERKEPTSILKTNKQIFSSLQKHSLICFRDYLKIPLTSFNGFPFRYLKKSNILCSNVFQKTKQKIVIIYLSHCNGIGASTHAFILVVVLLSLAFLTFSSHASPQSILPCNFCLLWCFCYK